MKISIDTAKSVDALGSITNNTVDRQDALDSESPYVFVEWLQKIGAHGEEPEEHITEYGKYLREWNNKNGLSKAAGKQVVVDRYKALLKDITLNHTTSEEKRFLQNINYDNPRHIEAALPFFATKIRELSLYFAQERDNIKYQKVKAVLGGTVYGAAELVYKYIPQLLRRDDFTLQYQDTPIDVSPIGLYSDFKVNIRETYDITQEYFTQSSVDIDPTLFSDISTAISEVLQECKPKLQLSDGVNLILNDAAAGIEGVFIDSDTTGLALSVFSNYTNNIDNLNAYNKAKLLPTLLGTGLEVLSGGSITPLIAPSNNWRNIFTRYQPTFNNTPSSKLTTIEELGGYFTPANLGVLTYYSLKPTPVVRADMDLTKEYVLPDTSKYGNSIMSASSGLPITHKEDVQWLKADSANGSLLGDIINDRTLPKFYNYRSIEEIATEPKTGISRSTDAYGFFTGEKGDIWANSDIYEPLGVNVFDIDSRQEDLVVGHDTLYRWRTDIYGNEYSLYKSIRPVRLPGSNESGTAPVEDFQGTTGCEIIDGGTTLKKQPPPYTTDVFYQYYDGGRKPGVDPKTEQSNLLRPFDDLRTPDWEGNIPDHNSYYYGPNPNQTEGGIDIYQITYHGFDRKGIIPIYDQQSYCGMFTDQACGVIAAGNEECVIADNYSFYVFSEPDNISHSRPSTDDHDAFEYYANPSYDEFDGSIGFSNHGAPSEFEIIESNSIDGRTFNDNMCSTMDIEYRTDNDSIVPLYRGSMNIAETAEMTVNSDTSQSTPTIYEQKRAGGGSLYFRSYNGTQISNIQDIFSDVFKYYGFFDNSDYDKVKEDISNNNITDMDVIYDTLVVQTSGHILMEKVNFNAEYSKVLPNNTTNVLLRTAESRPLLEKSIGWFLNEDDNILLTGTTATEVIDGNVVVYPRLFQVDIKTLEYKQVFPNADYPEGIDDYILTGDLASYDISEVDQPIISYDEKTDKYNVSYSATLTDGDNRIYTIFTSDFKYKRLNLQLQDNAAYHSLSTLAGDDISPTTTKVVYLPGEAAGVTQPESEVKYHHMTLNETISAHELMLSIDTETIPVSGYKVNKIIVNHGDGILDVREREIGSGLTDLSFDITTLPDPSDIGDPRRGQIDHTHNLNSTVPTTRTVSVSAVYSDFSKLIYNIDINTQPITVSALGGLKMINSKIYTDLTGAHKHLITLETQNPKYVSNVVLTR